MGRILIRWGTVDDAPAVADVHVASWRAAYRGLIDQEVLDGLDVHQRAASWARWIAASDAQKSTDNGVVSHRILVAVVDGSVQAWASFGAGRDPEMTELGELAGIYAHPRVWSQHVGHELLVRVEAELKLEGWADAYLWVLNGNDRAIHFYERHGWNADGREKFGDLGGARRLHELRHLRHLG